MISVSDTLVKRISDEDIEGLVAETSYLNEVCVRIETDLTSITSRNNNQVCALNNLSDDQVNDIINITKQEGGSHLFKNYRLSYPFNDKDLFIYGKVTTLYNQPIVVMVSSTIEPLNATISTIQSQYLIIVAIIIIVTILLALLISQMIIKPIKRINTEVKKLPKGKYDDTKTSHNSSEFKELNDTLVAANKEINKADRARKELLSNVSHDLRTPLTMIVGYGEMIRDIKEENNDENINVIINEAKRLSSLVDDLLDVSRIENEKLVLNLEDVSLNDFLTNVYNQYQKYCSSLGIDFSLELDEDAIITIDKKRIGQVLYNFLNNAINYNDNEHKIIKIMSKEEESRYKISVYDNGQGIKKEDIENIWSRYYKVDQEHVRFHIGSGIGLSLAKQLLDSHGFEYGVESVYGEYSVFYFYIEKEEDEE